MREIAVACRRVDLPRLEADLREVFGDRLRRLKTAQGIVVVTLDGPASFSDVYSVFVIVEEHLPHRLTAHQRRRTDAPLPVRRPRMTLEDDDEP